MKTTHIETKTLNDARAHIGTIHTQEGRLNMPEEANALSLLPYGSFLHAYAKDRRGYVHIPMVPSDIRPIKHSIPSSFDFLDVMRMRE